MALINLIRLCLFGTSIVFSLIVLGILANFMSITMTDGYYYHGFALGIAVSVMTLVAVIASLVIGKIRKGAFISMICVELAWTGLLWVLWLAAAGSITTLGIFTTCGYYNSKVESNCRQYQAAQAFSWLSWLMFFGWFVTLLALSVIAASRGNTQVWKASTTEYPFFAPAGEKNAFNAPSSYATPTPQYNQQYPVAPQQQPQTQYQYGGNQSYSGPQQGYSVQQQPYGGQQPYGAPQQPYNSPQQPPYPQV